MISCQEILQRDFQAAIINLLLKWFWGFVGEDSDSNGEMFSKSLQMEFLLMPSCNWGNQSRSSCRLFLLVISNKWLYGSGYHHPYNVIRKNTRLRAALKIHWEYRMELGLVKTFDLLPRSKPKKKPETFRYYSVILYAAGFTLFDWFRAIVDDRAKFKNFQGFFW